MKPRKWLRIAAGILAIHAVAHSLGTLTNPQAPGVDALINTMRNFHFDAMGWDRTAWDFFRGLGLLFSVTLAALTVFCWQVGNLSEKYPSQARPFVITLLAANVLIGILAWIYFFIVPVVLSTLAAACLVLAGWSPRQSV